MSPAAPQPVEIASGSITFTYKTASGRPEWLSQDPIGESGGVNLYGYVANNPIDLVDPYGLLSTGSLSSSGAAALAEIEAVQAGYGTAAKMMAARQAAAAAAARAAADSSATNCEDCIKECDKYKDHISWKACVVGCARKYPPTHPDYKPPEGGPKKGKKNGRSGWLDENGDVWWVDDTHYNPHYDVQKDKGTREYKPIPGVNR